MYLSDLNSQGGIISGEGGGGHFSYLKRGTYDIRDEKGTYDNGKGSLIAKEKGHNSLWIGAFIRSEKGNWWEIEGDLIHYGGGGCAYQKEMEHLLEGDRAVLKKETEQLSCILKRGTLGYLEKWGGTVSRGRAASVYIFAFVLITNWNNAIVHNFVLFHFSRRHTKRLLDPRIRLLCCGDFQGGDSPLRSALRTTVLHCVYTSKLQCVCISGCFEPTQPRTSRQAFSIFRYNWTYIGKLILTYTIIKALWIVSHPSETCTSLHVSYTSTYCVWTGQWMNDIIIRTISIGTIIGHSHCIRLQLEVH